MKILPVLSTLAALVAFALFSYSIALTGSLFFAAGLAAIIATDYARKPRSLQPRAAIVLLSRSAIRPPAFELAA